MVSASLWPTIANVITDTRLPEVGCLSWIRAYHTGVFADRLPADLVRRAQARGLPLTLLDVDEHMFFDIQALRQGHVARAKLPPIEVTGEVVLPGTDGVSRSRGIRAEVVTHLLLHQSGFMVIRPTIRFDRISAEGGITPAALHKLERAVWAMATKLSWWIPELDTPLRGFARTYMNYVFFSVLVRWSRQRVRPKQIAVWAEEGMHGCERLHELTRAGVLEHPYPVSFGTDIQVVVPMLPQETPDQWNRRIAPLAWEIMRPESAAVDTAPSDIEPDAQTVAWFMDESVSLLVRADGAFHPELDVVDADRSQVVEFLALRRGGLNSVQRATQRVITERIAISRRQLGQWQYLVATLTDDYVLASRIGVLLEPIKESFARDRRLRDLGDLERQVRQNLDWFQARIEAAGQWTGGLIGAAVGAAALAFSLAEPVRLLLAWATGTSAEAVVDRYALLLALSILAVVVVSFVGSFALVLRLSTRLKPLVGRGRRRDRRARARRARRWGRAPVPRQVERTANPVREEAPGR